MDTYFFSVFISLAFTNMLEAIVAIILKIHNKDDFYTIIGINCLTNPIAVYITNVWLETGSTSLIIRVVCLEFIIIIVEGYLLKKFMKQLNGNPYLFSFFANVFSFCAGTIIFIPFLKG